MAAVGCVVQDSLIAMMVSYGYGMLPTRESESIVTTPAEGEISSKSGFRASFLELNLLHWRLHSSRLNRKNDLIGKG